MQRFLERNHDVGFDVAAAFGAPRPLSKTAAAEATLPAAASEKLLEEIAESSSTEFEFDPAIAAAITMESSAWLLRVPSRWRLKPAGLIPICAELIVLLPFRRVAQNFIGLVELFEFFLRRRLVLVDIGMVFARQLAEGFLISSSVAVLETPSVS